jgi:hypothetical protein
MPERAPAETTNRDRYGSPALPWSRARHALAVPSHADRFFLGTLGPGGRPHATGMGALWCDGDLYVVSAPGTHKSRNLAANPACTITAALRGIDLVFEGEATRVSDGPTLERLAALYRAQGWPAQVEGDAFTAPTARRAPGHRPGTCTASRSTPPSGSPPRSQTARRAGGFRP